MNLYLASQATSASTPYTIRISGAPIMRVKLKDCLISNRILKKTWRPIEPKKTPTSGFILHCPTLNLQSLIIPLPVLSPRSVYVV